MLRSKYPAFPYLLFMVIFIAVPLCMVAYFAFTGADGSFTTANIVGVAAYSSVILRSLWMAFVATVISLLLGYPFAYFMAKRTTHVRRTMLMLIMLPMWMNFLLRTYAWMTILENNGLINRLLRLLGLGTLQLINTQGAVVLGMVYDYLPFMIIPLYTVLIKMDVSVIQAAQDLGLGGDGGILGLLCWLGTQAFRHRRGPHGRGLAIDQPLPRHIPGVDNALADRGRDAAQPETGQIQPGRNRGLLERR
ncbi:MAG TPA: ABC transporter permease, partial [Oscillospiraceae bacterium]|nr:ABC transporter permease [Oscillospiraceae bacterium]